MARSGRVLLVAAAAVLGLRYCFLASPDTLPKAKSGIDFKPAVAASAALPALTMLAEDAEAKYGDNLKWFAILVPLTTLVFPMVAFGSFVLSSPFRRMLSGVLWDEAWKMHLLFANAQEPKIVYGLTLDYANIVAIREVLGDDSMGGPNERLAEP